MYENITVPPPLGTLLSNFFHGHLRHRACTIPITGMRKFRIDQDFLIEHWHMIYIMPVVFAEI